MAPIRRYLRITKYSVIECRIYLDNPGLAHTWLLNPRKPVLQRVIESVRPYVLPKLREERERARNKRSAKKKGIKDVVVEDDFEVSIFLTETSTRHSLVTKHKHFHDTTQTKLKSNSGRLISETNDAPVDLDMVAEPATVIRREESDDDDATVALAAIPAMDDTAPTDRTRPPKRTRSNTDIEVDTDASRAPSDQNNQFEVVSDEDSAREDDDGLFVPSPTRESPSYPPPKRQKPIPAAGEGGDDDKKKLAMDISYEGFSIYGRVLCLVVKRRDNSGAESTERGGGNASTAAADGNGSSRTKNGSRGRGQAMMENFIISTQIPAGTDVP
ncbi:hypothetical protein SAMD00023353_1001170 [Rosellinia necatrix]|uniref:Uncharacterized protein n=1 Tax=Rosellinia necatrix TaxID=77044 RepID=A0A1W2TBR8_ROSNE|nr:hypothetical protein SAMD00023353_1001170 [Rosellinia necatrix]